MAIMRTNRLTSKTTPPDKTQANKGVTVSNKPRTATPWAELEAQDAAYKKYQKDLPAYNEKMKQYETERKRVYGFGGENISRSLNPAELSEYNSRQRQEGGLEYKKVKVDPSYNKKPTDADWMIGTAHRTYDPIKPTAPGEVRPPDWTTAQLDKMTIKKPTISTSNAKLKTRTPEKPELATFESPGVQKKGKASTGGTSVSMNPFAKGATTKGAAGRYVKQVVQSVGKTGGKSKDMMGYNRQEKQFKAYAGTSVLGESHIGKTAQDLNAYKKEYKSQRKEYRKEGNAEGVAATSMEVKQARQAEKFVKGNQTHFNDENYRKTTGKTSRIAPDYRNSAENAANRNTMQAKLNAISAQPKNKTNMY